MAYSRTRRTRSTGGYSRRRTTTARSNRGGYASRGRSTRRRAPARSGGGRTQTVRLVLEQAPATQVSRGAELMRMLNPAVTSKPGGGKAKM